MGKISEKLAGKTAIITGGSKGIGRAVAEEFVRQGGSVCIIARNARDLEVAADTMRKLRPDAANRVTARSCDTTDMKKIKGIIDDFVKEKGIPDYLINFVGYAYPKYVQDLTFDDFKKNMEANYYGQLAPVLAILPHYMKERRGHIVTCSSVLGYLGMMGYATYNPTKFAICGLTESLRHELKPYGITFSILYPPDTDTPGFEKESETKPIEVALISESGGLMAPSRVAEALLRGVVKNKFYILPGQARLLWTITRHFPKLAHWIMDGELAKARKKADKNKK